MLDELIELLPSNYFNHLKKYDPEGLSDDKQNFKRLLLFLDQETFKKVKLEIKEIDRLLNAYYWYSIYIQGLKKYNIATTSHEQAKFKILENISHLKPEIDFSIIKNIEKSIKEL